MRLSVSHMGFLLGIVLFVVLLAVPTLEVFSAFVASQHPTASGADQAMAAAGMQKVFALLGLMVCWWLTEAIAIPVTALVPVVAIPFLHISFLSGDGVLQTLTPKDVLVSYADPIVFLFMGSFFLATALTAHGIDKRFTLWTLSVPVFARSPANVVLGTILASGVLSMWMNNTATTAMLVPVALGILRNLPSQDDTAFKNFGTVLILGIAWASSIGGIATVVGTAPNGIAVSVLQQQNIASVSFLEWFSYGFPMSIVLLFVAWVYLSWRLPYHALSFQSITDTIATQRVALGAMSGGEKKVLAIFGCTALAWIGLPLLKATGSPGVVAFIQPLDTWVVAMSAAGLLFVVPDNWGERRFLLNWSDARGIDWGTLLLFGGGLALSTLLFKTGSAAWIAYGFTALLGTPSTVLLVVLLVLLVNFLTEITSNTATTSMMMPIVISIAVQAGADAKAVAMGVAIGASLAFMLPVATPPNAIAFGTGKIPLHTMVRVGFAMNLMSWVVVCAVMLFVLFIAR